MPNSFDAEGRGPSNARLLLAGITFLLVSALVVVLMIAKSRGALDSVVRVSADLINVGDGLPEKSDVKFRGVLVGYVAGVTPAQQGRPNIVRIDLKPGYASGIPGTVTARVVPSNVFAVSSVQLVDNGITAEPLRAGAVIAEDQTLPTVLFQTTLDKFRKVLAAIGREPDPNSVGWLTALGQATSGRGHRLEDAGHDVNEMVHQLNTVVTDKPGPSTLSTLAEATATLRGVAPGLLDALDSAVQPMKTLAEKRSALSDFLSSGVNTMGRVGDSFDNQTDRLIGITTKLSPVMGVLADRAGTLNAIAVRLETLVKNVMDIAWNYDTNELQAQAVIALTPTRTYVRADCPRYGNLAGPSCFTAPEVPTAPALSTALGSMGLPMPPGVNENRPNFAPPRGSVLPPEAYGPPPGPPPDAPPPGVAPPSQLPAEAPPPAPAQVPPAVSAPPPVPGPPAAAPQASAIGGNVGPVGSQQEKDQLKLITGGHSNVATELLLAPLVRGTTVRLDTGGGSR
jgi:virulence factor Mce-like protein